PPHERVLAPLRWLRGGRSAMVRRVRCGPSSATWGPSLRSSVRAWLPSSEVLPFASVRRYPFGAFGSHQNDVIEALTHLAGLGVAHDDPICDFKVARGLAFERGL